MIVVRLLIVALVLASTLRAQTTGSSDTVPSRVLRTATIIGTQPQLEELALLRTTPQPNELKELQLVQQLQGKVIASALDVDSVNARIDYEMARLQDVQTLLAARRDQRVNLLNVANLVVGGGVGAVGSGLQLISSAQHAGNIVSTSAGVGGTILSLIGLRPPKGLLRAPGYTPAMLAKPLGAPLPPESDFPPEVWAYLTTPDPSIPQGSTRQQHLMSEWVGFHHLAPKPDPKSVAQLTSTGKSGAPLGIDVIGDRLAMLADLRAHVSGMLVDLAGLMSFVVQPQK